MTIYFITRYYKGTINAFIESWAKALQSRIQVIRYRELPFLKRLPAGCYLFADLERARPWEAYFARRLCNRIEARAEGSLILNDPRRYTGKFELLARWHQQGVNRFRAFRPNDLPGANDLKFPVFLRRDLDHRGAIGGLIHSREELNRVLAHLSLRDRFRKHRLMVVEYCDCADATGVFRKYSAMNICGRLAPSHIYFSQRWLTKVPDLINDTSTLEESEFVATFPHRDQVAAAFRIAGLEYGRMDYGVKNGRIQVWEINTNPIIVRRREVIHPQRMESQSASARMIAEAFQLLSEQPLRAQPT